MGRLKDVVALMINDKTARDRAIRTVTECTAEIFPIVRSVQAGQDIFEVGKKVKDFATKVYQAADGIQHFVPEMQVMAQSFGDSAKILGYFNAAATTVGIGCNIVQTYQGVQALQLIAAKLEDISTQLAAQTALIAQRDFPQYVYAMIAERLGQTTDDPNCDHWFFLYHPDNDWYPKFYHLLEKNPLGPRFCGYTNQIDTVFLFMLAARQRIEERNQRPGKKGKPNRHVRLHLLMPAYQPVLIMEALKIPEEIGDFVMEGRVNSNREFVWLNLPDNQRHYVVDIGQWVPPNPGFWDWAMTRLGITQEQPGLKEPRVIGTRQGSGDLIEGVEQEICSEDDATTVSRDLVLADDVHKPDSEGSRRDATPLHQRRRRRQKKLQK